MVSLVGYWHPIMKHGGLELCMPPALSSHSFFLSFPRPGLFHNRGLHDIIQSIESGIAPGWVAQYQLGTLNANDSINLFMFPLVLYFMPLKKISGKHLSLWVGRCGWHLVKTEGAGGPDRWETPVGYSLMCYNSLGVILGMPERKAAQRLMTERQENLPESKQK